MLFPKKVKYRKWQRKRENPKKIGVAMKGNKVNFGSFGLKAYEPKEIKVNQIEAARRTMTRFMAKNGKIWIRVFPNRPITQKAAEVGMGKGKGDPVGFVARVKPGKILFEVDGVDESIAREALRKAGAKLPLKTKFVTREQ